MGKKPKNVKPKLFDKTNNCNFTLVFIKPTVEEKAIRVEKRKHTELIERTRLELTTKNFQKDLNNKDEEDSENDDLLFDSEDDVRDEEEEDDDYHKGLDETDVPHLLGQNDTKDVFVEDLNSVRYRNKKNENTCKRQTPKHGYDVPVSETRTDSPNELIFDEPLNLDSLLAILSKALNFKKYEKDKVFFKNDYIFKFNINIELFSMVSFVNFNKILQELSKLLSHPKCKRFIVEIPFDVVSRVKKCLTDQRLTTNYHRAYIGNISIGSLVNLSKYFVHFEVPKNINSTKALPMMAEIKFLQRCMAIHFYLDSHRIVHKLFYNFSSFRTIVVEHHETFDRIYFECIQAPAMHYAELTDKECDTLSEVDVCDLSLTWKRTIQFKFMPKRNFHDNSTPLDLKPTDDSLLGLSKTFCIDVLETDKDPFLDKLLQVAYICRERNKAFQLYLSHVQHIECRNNYAEFKALLTSCQFPFSIHFASLVLFSSSYKVLDALQDEKCLSDFLGDIKQEAVQSPDTNELACLEQCIYHLKVLLKENPVIAVYEEFSKLLRLKEKYTPEELHEDYVMIRRATLYPSHLELVQPVSLLKSRFTNLANLEYGIRMTVLDDNHRVLNKCKDPNEFDFIMGILKPQLLEGVRIGDRIYEFLGSSTSQMRDNGCTLYAQDSNGRNAEDVRNAAGELRVFNRNVSKYIARFGLVFSQAMTIIELNHDVLIKFTKDILGDVKPNCRNYVNLKKEQHILSDGIGIVSKSVAEMFQPYLQLKADYFPSAYQIRFGGCKGMLVVWDVPQRSIIFRNSMKKYDSDSRLLGILKYSMPRSVFLNRPLINILDHIKVNRNEFYRYFYQSTTSVAKATLYDSCAMDLIRTYSTGLLPYDNILNASISLLDEPFLRSIINYLIYYRLNFELKWKARIRVPNDSGRIAFGVIDETKTLEYGEIYFQFTKMNEEGGLLPETVILEGEVMVTKFPCLQPGDVRKFQAVKVDKLSHIKDCLVFPAKGKRPHPDEMGGSDLDGDEYAIFWNTLKFPGPNNEPMDFPYGLSKGQTCDITIDDIVDFFCSYLVMNNIGMVANMHLMLSDYLAGGLDTKECEDLAYTYQISLDFPKTGVINPAPRKYFMTIRPDFMERNNYDKVYLSKKMLGEFYRHCSLVERAIELSQHDYRFSMFDPSKKKKKKELNTKHFKNPKSFIKNKLILNGWKKFYPQAEEAFLEYKLKVVDIMEQLEVENEVMLYADVYEDKKDVTKNLINYLFAHFKTKFEKQCKELDCVKSIDRLYLASAWYAICYDKCFSYNGKPLLGLPWIIAEEICQLAQFSFSGKVKTDATMGMNMRTMVDHHGERWTIFIGINHKELIPYRPENELFFDMLFDYQTKNVYNTKVVHFFWCPFAVVQAFKQYHPHLLALHHELIDDIQLKIVLGLIMKWMNLIKRRIYQDMVSDRSILLFDERNGTCSNVQDDEQGQKGCRTIDEEELLRHFVMKRLLIIFKKCGRKRNRIGESLPTISTLFNLFLFYLFEICNRVNSAIYNVRMEEIFLLKYAIFALSFINKLDWKLDRNFYSTFSLDMQTGNWGMHIFILEQIYARKNTGENVDLEEEFSPTQFDSVNVYHKSLDSLFENYLVDNSSLVHETISFNLLPSPKRVDLREVKSALLPKLYYLSGVSNIEFSLSNEDTAHLENDKENQSAASKEQQEQPSTSTSLPTSSIPEVKATSNGTTEICADKPVETNVINGSISEEQPQKPRSQPRLKVTTFGPDFSRKPGSQVQSEVNVQPRDPKVDIERMIKNGHYLVKTSGLVHSTQILRLLIGHPLFFDKICYRFDVSSNEPKEKEVLKKKNSSKIKENHLVSDTEKQLSASTEETSSSE